MVLLTSTGKETTPEIAAFFKFYGALFFIGGLGSLALVFYQMTLLAFAVLFFVMLTMLCFIFGLNKRM